MPQAAPTEPASASRAKLTAPARRTIASPRHFLRALRPKQWTKNLLVYFALVFSVNQYWTPGNPGELATNLTRATAAFLIFCALSSAQYLINDVLDVSKDRLHPRKRHRPIAAGLISVPQAVAGAVALLVVGLIAAVALDPLLGLAGAAYFLLMLGYSFSLKHLVIVDVFAIAAGFVLRAAAGAIAIGVPISPWFYTCTVLGALFLGFSKRRHELVLLEGGAGGHRRILEEYSPHLLDQMISVVTTSTVIAYALYTFTEPNLPSNHAMMLTIPFVLYGIFRYLYLIHQRNEGGSPEEILLRDKPLIVDIVLWIAASVGILFAFR